MAGSGLEQEKLNLGSLEKLEKNEEFSSWFSHGNGREIIIFIFQDDKNRSFYLPGQQKSFLLSSRMIKIILFISQDYKNLFFYLPG